MFIPYLGRITLTSGTGGHFRIDEFASLLDDPGDGRHNLVLQDRTEGDRHIGNSYELWSDTEGRKPQRATLAMIWDPAEQVDRASSTTKSRPVRLTESMLVWWPSGWRVSLGPPRRSHRRFGHAHDHRTAPVQVDTDILSFQAKSSFASGSWIRTPECCPARISKRRGLRPFAAPAVRDATCLALNSAGPDAVNSRPLSRSEARASS